MNVSAYLPYMRKALIVVVAVVTQCIATGLIPAEYAQYVNIILTALAAAGVYIVPNATQPTAPAEEKGAAEAPVDEGAYPDVALPDVSEATLDDVESRPEND